jgi:acetate kinase
VSGTPLPPGPNRSVLAINRGSSSVKFGLFTIAPDPSALSRGTIDEASHATTVDQVLERIADRLGAYPLAGIGHRIVHGGPSLFDPQLVTDGTIATLEGLVPFAPNHLPGEIELIEAARRLRPDVPQLVCFDTAFHSNLPDMARRLPIPQVYDAQGVRRYGFHGLSYTFLLDELRRRAGPRQAGGKVVLMHLGNGSSLAAVRDGRSVDTSMGFTPIGGVVMSTRSGDLDPGVVTYIARTTGFDADRVEHELSHRSGLAGVSGGVGDLRDLLAREANDEACRLAVSIYCYEITKRIGAYAAALGGLDALVFSGGIGEHAPVVRARILSGLEFLGIAIDGRGNAGNAPVISTPAARVTVHVIPTDEEVVIAKAAYQLLHGRS